MAHAPGSVKRFAQEMVSGVEKVGRPISHMRKLSPGEVEVASSGSLRAVKAKNLEFRRGPDPECAEGEKVTPWSKGADPEAGTWPRVSTAAVELGQCGGRPRVSPGAPGASLSSPRSADGGPP